MTDPFNPSSDPAPEYEPTWEDPVPMDPGGPEMPDVTPSEVPQFDDLSSD